MELLCVIKSIFIYKSYENMLDLSVSEIPLIQKQCSTSDNQRLSNIQNSTEIALAVVCMYVCVCTYMNGFECVL